MTTTHDYRKQDSLDRASRDTARPVVEATPGLHGRVLQRVDENIHRVVETAPSGEFVIVGFIEEVGAVFVTLAGPHYDRSVEIAQSLSLERAVFAFSQHR